MKMRNGVWLAVAIIMILAITPVLASCAPAEKPASTLAPTPAPTPTPEAKVTGTVTYLAKIALPPGSVVEVKLQDVSRADAPAITIGEQVITTSGNQVPFPFEIKYNPITIDPRYTYVVRATITVDGKLWFTTDTRYAVITQGNPSSVEMTLTKVTTPTPAPTLENTTWVLQSYGQPGNLKPVLKGSEIKWKDTEITAVFDSAKGRVAGSAGVNTYGGGYELKDNKLSILGLVSTLMAGPQPLMDQETEYLTALQAAESYKIEGDKLTITCGSKALIFTKK